MVVSPDSIRMAIYETGIPDMFSGESEDQINSVCNVSCGNLGGLNLVVSEVCYGVTTLTETNLDSQDFNG